MSNMTMVPTTYGFVLPVDVCVGLPGDAFTARLVERLTWVLTAKAGQAVEVVVTYDELGALSSDEANPDAPVRAIIEYAHLLEVVFGLRHDLAMAWGRQLAFGDGQNEKTALRRIFSALVSGSWASPIAKRYDSWGAIINPKDNVTLQVIRELHYDDNQEVVGYVEPFGFEVETLSKQDLPVGVTYTAACDALQFIAGGAKTILVDNIELARWINGRGGNATLVSKDWMHFALESVEQADVEALIALHSPIPELFGVSFCRGNMPMAVIDGLPRFTRPCVTMTQNLVTVMDNGWSELFLGLMTALDATLGVEERGARGLFLTVMRRLPIWADSEQYVVVDGCRAALNRTAAAVLLQEVNDAGGLTLRTLPGYLVGKALITVRHSSKYVNAWAHDQGACIYLNSEIFGTCRLTVAEAAKLNELEAQGKGRFSNDTGGPLHGFTTGIPTADKAKLAKRTRGHRGLSFMPVNPATSNLVVGEGELEGLMVDIVYFPHAIGAQAGDAIVANNDLWEQQSRHLVFHNLEGEADGKLVLHVHDQQRVKKGDVLMSDAIRQLKAPVTGTIEYARLEERGDQTVYCIIVRELRHTDLKPRNMMFKVSAHSYPEMFNPWRHQKNKLFRNGLPAALVITQDGGKGRGKKGVSYAVFQLYCDTTGTQLHYNPVDDALGKYDWMLEDLENYRVEGTLRWVMTQTEYLLAWAPKGVTIGSTVDDQCGGTFEMVEEYIEFFGERRPVLYHHTWGYAGKTVFKAEAAGVADALGLTRTMLETSYWLDSVGCPKAARWNYEAGHEEFELLRRLHAMNVTVPLGEAASFNFDAGNVVEKMPTLLAEGAVEGTQFRKVAEAFNTEFIVLTAENSEVVLDLPALDRFIARNELGVFTGLAATALQLLLLTATPDSAKARALMVSFKAQLKRLVDSGGANKRAHRGAMAVNAKRRAYKFIPYGESWIVAHSPKHRLLTAAMGIDWAKELEQFEETGVWSVEGTVSLRYRAPMATGTVTTTRVLPEDFGLSGITHNVNALQASTDEGDLDGDEEAEAPVTDAEAADELRGGPTLYFNVRTTDAEGNEVEALEPRRLSWAEYQQEDTIRCFGEGVDKHGFGEHQTPDVDKYAFGWGRVVFVNDRDLEINMADGCEHQTSGLGLGFNTSIVALARASANPTRGAFASFCYKGVYEVKLGGYSPADHALGQAMYNAEPAELLIAMTGNKIPLEVAKRYHADLLLMDRVLRANSWGISKRGALPFPLTPGDQNTMWLGLGVRLMGKGELYAPLTRVYNREIFSYTLGIPEGKLFLSTFLRSEFCQALLTGIGGTELSPTVDAVSADLPDFITGTAMLALRRFVAHLVPFLAGYQDAVPFDASVLAAAAPTP